MLKIKRIKLTIKSMKQLADEFQRFNKRFSMSNTKSSKAVAIMMEKKKK